MSTVIHHIGPALVTCLVCDLCGAIEERMLTDTYTQMDICLGCASTGDRGLFFRVTSSPNTEGDNLMGVAKEMGLLTTDEED